MTKENMKRAVQLYSLLEEGSYKLDAVMSKNKMWLFAWTWGGEDHNVVVFADTETYARMIFNLEYLGDVPDGLEVPCMEVDRQQLQVYCGL